MPCLFKVAVDGPLPGSLAVSAVWNVPAGAGKGVLIRPRRCGGAMEGVLLGRWNGTWSVTRAQARAYQAKGHE